MLSATKKFILDTLFPIACLSCGVPDAWLCRICLNKIETLSLQGCPYCERAETPAGAICNRCKIKFIGDNQLVTLDNLVVATRYTQTDIARLIHAFKYNFVRDLRLPLSTLMQKALLDNQLPLPDIIIPVPLHPRRLRWRGFNQAQLLAESLAADLSPGLTIPVIIDLAIRKKFTPPQMKIKNYQARKNNMQNSFALSELYFSQPEVLRDKKILLVDDIATTGSTLLECARVLKLAGAKKVFGVVIARQEMD